METPPQRLCLFSFPSYLLLADLYSFILGHEGGNADRHVELMRVGISAFLLQLRDGLGAIREVLCRIQLFLVRSSRLGLRSRRGRGGRRRRSCGLSGVLFRLLLSGSLGPRLFFLFPIQGFENKQAIVMIKMYEIDLPCSDMFHVYYRCS